MIEQLDIYQQLHELPIGTTDNIDTVLDVSVPCTDLGSTVTVYRILSEARVLLNWSLNHI